MLEQGSNNISAFHLAGVVPISGANTDFSFPWHSSLQPIANNYLAVERSVVECGFAGCETIWIVCNDDIQPIIKNRIGDFIEDPYYMYRSKYKKFPNEARRQIPIFYTPIHPKDRDRRDSLGWAALHGALTSFIVSSKISKWVVPSRYYVSFPYGVHDPSHIINFRKKISHTNQFFLTCGDKSIKTGDYLSFTMNADEYKQYVWDLKNKCTGGNRDISSKERWSSKHFTLDKIFGSATIDKSNSYETDWYYPIDSWENYRTYLASKHASHLQRPNERLIKYSEYSKAGENNEH
jgi:hypothetical protein